MGNALYANDKIIFDTDISVTYLTENGTKLIRYFDSPFKATKFANKIRHSKKCKLVACSGFFM